MNDSEFKRKYRVTRATLDKIPAAIETNEVFAKGARGPKQIPVKHQLMVLLHFLGKEGESNESQDGNSESKNTGGDTQGGDPYFFELPPAKFIEKND